MLGSLVLAIVVLVRLDWAHLPVPTTGMMVGAALFHGLAIALLGYLWKWLLLTAGNVRVTWPEVVAHIGATLAGKYLPGKVWGLVSRGAMLSQKSLPVGDTVAISVVEQGVLMHAAAVVAGAAWGLFTFAEGGSPVLLGAALAVAWLSVHVVSRWLPDIIKVCHPLLSRLRLGAASSSRVWQVIQGRRYGYLIVGFCAYWCLLGAVLWQWMPPSAPMGLSMAGLVLATVPIAVVAGFLALWVPSGIGVREGVMVTLLMIVIPVQDAIGLSLLFRCWCILVDIVVGGLALLFYRRQLKVPPQEDS